jgi:hypothetical protein
MYAHVPAARSSATTPSPLLPPQEYMCPHNYCVCVLITTVCVSSYYCMCPHTTVYVSSYYFMCALLLLYVCPHTTVCILILRMCVLMLLYVCPHTTVRRQVGLFAHVCSRTLTYAHVCRRKIGHIEYPRQDLNERRRSSGRKLGRRCCRCRRLHGTQARGLRKGGGGHALAGGAVQVEERAELQEYIYTRGGAMSRYGGGGVAVVQRQQRARGVLAFRAGQ